MDKIQRIHLLLALKRAIAPYEYDRLELHRLIELRAEVDVKIQMMRDNVDVDHEPKVISSKDLQAAVDRVRKAENT
jgi:hypothetical protein